jgi:hypothetical protein
VTNVSIGIYQRLYIRHSQYFYLVQFSLITYFYAEEVTNVFGEGHVYL